MPPVLHRQAEARRLRRPRRAVQPPLRRPQEEGLSVTDVDRRSALLGAKLSALLARQLDGSPPPPIAFPLGAAALVDGEAWVLLEERPGRGLGAALAWAVRRGADRLHVVADRATSTLARRAQRFALPITVWQVGDGALQPATPRPPDPPVMAHAGHLTLADTILAAGADLVVEHGVVAGEVRGLEVCRVVDRPETGDVTLEVGVGRHDREAFGLIHGDVPTVAALAAVVRQVEAQRTVGAEPHPLNRLARERFVRWRLVVDPSLAAAETVTPVEPLTARTSIADAAPCDAIADAGGVAPFDVVCSAGIDLDVVPHAADVQHEGRSLRIVLPRGDLLPLTRDLAGLLRTPVELVTID